MPEVQKPPSSLEHIDRLTDQPRRAVEAIAFAAYAKDRAKQARDIRDDAMCSLKASGWSVHDIAAVTGMSVAMVRIVVR